MPGRTVEVELDGVVGQAGRAPLTGDFTGQHGTDGAMDIADRQLELKRRAIVDGFPGGVDHLVIERLFQPVILPDDAAAGDALRNFGIVEDGRKVDALALPVADGFA